MPVSKTNRRPRSAARLLMGGRPPLGEGFCSGRIGSISAQSASERMILAMPYSVPQRVLLGALSVADQTAFRQIAEDTRGGLFHRLLAGMRDDLRVLRRFVGVGDTREVLDFACQ